MIVPTIHIRIAVSEVFSRARREGIRNFRFFIHLISSKIGDPLGLYTAEKYKEEDDLNVITNNS